MLVNQENLKKGDEIMLAIGCKFAYAKVIRPPKLRWKKDSTGTIIPVVRTWNPDINKQLYSSTKCEVKTITTHFPARYAGGKPYTTVKIDNSLPDYNDEKYFDLNFRDIWLIEK